MTETETIKHAEVPTGLSKQGVSEMPDRYANCWPMFSPYT
jgi:hypothetical protein